MADRSWRHDLALVGWAALTFASLLASFTGFRPVRDALVLDGKPDEIPWLFAGTFIAVSIASPLWSMVLARRPKRRVVPIAFHVFALCALVFAAIIWRGTSSLAVGRAFYIWSSVFNLFVVSVFWSLLADLVGPGRAKALFGPISAGGTIGAFVGPLLTKLLVAHIDVAGILVITALLLELAVIGVWRIRLIGERTPVERAELADTQVHASAWTGIVRVVKTPFLLAIVAYVLCTATAATFLYLEQAAIVKSAFAHLAEGAARIARTDFFASLDLWTAAITLGVQVLIAGPLLRWLGPGIVLCVLPLMQLAATSILAASGTLATLGIVMVATRAATHGLTRPSRELLFTVVDREDKYHAKNAIDTVGYRLGDLGSSWVHKGIAAISSGAGALVIAAIPLTAIWLALAITLGIGFRRRHEPTA